MAFESLADRLGSVFKKLRGKGKISEADLKEAMKEVKRALLEADVTNRSRKPHAGTAGYKNCKRRALRSYGKRNRET